MTALPTRPRFCRACGLAGEQKAGWSVALRGAAKKLSTLQDWKRLMRTTFLRTLRPLAAVSALILCGSTAFALESSVTEASTLSPDALWKKVGDFCGIAAWHPAIASCKLTDNGKRRILTLKDGGGAIVERLTRRDDAHHAYSYRIISSPLPVADYHSTISVAGAKDGSEFKWTGKYIAKGTTPADAKKVIDGVYQAGADAIVKP
jgi:hypothetical protein